LRFKLGGVNGLGIQVKRGCYFGVAQQSLNRSANIDRIVLSISTGSFCQYRQLLARTNSNKHFTSLGLTFQHNIRPGRKVKRATENHSVLRSPTGGE
jgi:type IV pilus biogenesis protein CpaD/CtpE